LLQQNTAPYKNVVPIKAGLWNSDRFIAITDPGNGKWGFRTKSEDKQSEVGDLVRGLTIAQLIDEHSIARIDLLKVDIEGAEKEVFESSASWIECVQAIVIELHDRFRPGCRAAFDEATRSRLPHRTHRGENLWVSRESLTFATNPMASHANDSSNEVLHVPIIATMLCGNNESLIGEAMESVIEYVNTFLLVDTGITDDSLATARRLGGEKLWLESFAWCNDFAKARNFALNLAGSHGPAWALTIDTDERIELGHVDDRESLREMLGSDSNIQTWLVSSRDGSYAKERFIRVPTQLEWRGRTHEALCGANAGQRRVLPGISFWEEPKTPEQFRKKLERDLDVLRDETQRKPENARWWYYLGQTLEQLGEHEQAVKAYRQCVELKSGWVEEAAWAAYCSARCLITLGRMDEAIDHCVLGLARQPASPELAWQAGYCCYQLGRDRDAIAWEEMALAIGHMEGSKAAQQRISFRHLPAWYEGPYDVMRHACRRLGDNARATEFERKYHHAMATRQGTVNKQRESRIEPATAQLPPPGVRDSHRPKGDIKRVAVLGLYSSGSTATAGILYHLGAKMGKQFWGNYYEPKWLSYELRRWWDEPRIREIVPPAERIRLLKRWLRDLSTDDPDIDIVAAKHPLLTLCGSDLIQAWGPDTKFIWTYRPLDQSIASLAQRGWWPEHYMELQETLWAVANSFFANHDHLRIDFADVLASPESQIDRIGDFLGIEFNGQQRQQAIASVKRER
jgi:FkbM family methyltransferase